MFQALSEAPPDPILGLTEAFKKDPTEGKINLGVGVYQDETGRTPVLDTVRTAARQLAESEKTKSYLPMTGSPEYGNAVQELIFGSAGALGGRAQTAQTPGGTGALRLAGDFVVRTRDQRPTIWVSDETWANHKGIYAAAGLEIKTYPYYDAASRTVKFDEMISTLKSIPSGDLVLLQGVCHNPTGVDMSPEQWKQVDAVVAERGLLPIVDFAYQGFAEGLEEDAVGVRTMCGEGREVLIASSFSKNFGLYSERVGALTVVGATPEATDLAMGHVKLAARTSYSNPPRHGGSLVVEIMKDPGLRKQWEGEVTAMRNRINEMRELFVRTLAEKGVPGDFSFIAKQRGMFSYSGLTAEQVGQLRDKHAIYIVKNGRINVAGMTQANMDRLCGAIADVVK